MGFDSFLSPFPPRSSMVPVSGQTIGMRNAHQVSWNDNEKGGTHAIGPENYGHFHAETDPNYKAAWYITTVQMFLTTFVQTIFILHSNAFTSKVVRILAFQKMNTS